jgi:hypothetical protein
LEQELPRIALDSIQEDKIMLHRLLYFLAIATPTLAGTIDSGTITTLGLGEPITWNVDISSTSGNYSVHFSPTAETTLLCVFCPSMHPGDFVTLSSTESAADFGSGGQATIGGTFYPTLIFDALGLGINSVMTLSTSFIVPSGAGGFTVPFTMTGDLQAATVADPAHFVLNDPVSGYGYAKLNVLGTEFLAQTITWTFVPEPSTVGLMGFGLALILGARVRRSIST